RSVKRAAEEPNHDKQVGGHRPDTACGPHPTACPNRSTGRAGQTDATRGTTYALNVRATYCAVQQSQVNAPYSATSRDASAISSSTIHKSGSAFRRRSQ